MASAFGITPIDVDKEQVLITHGSYLVGSGGDYYSMNEILSLTGDLRGNLNLKMVE